MTESSTDQEDQLAAIATKAGECPHCSEKAVRVASSYPGKATVVCDQGHQWEVETAD